MKYLHIINSNMPSSMIIPLPVLIQTINLNTLKIHLTYIIPDTSHIHATIYYGSANFKKPRVEVQYDAPSIY